MKSKTISLTASISLLVCCLPIIASAAPAKRSSPSPAPSASPVATSTMKSPRAIPYHGTVSAVDQNARTFTIAGKENSRVFKISDRTIVTKAAVSASMKDLTANDAVRGSYWKNADGTLEAKTVKIGPMTDAEKAATGKKSKKTTKTSKTDSTEMASPSPKK